jgi:insulysin
LEEEFYSATLAGLKLSVVNTTEGITIKIEGYNDKALLLLEKLIHTMKTFQVDRDQFSRIQDEAVREHRNRSLNNPYDQAKYYANYLALEKYWLNDEKLVELERITPEELQRYIPELLDRLHMEGFVHGNMSAQEAIRAGEIVETGLKSNPLFPSEFVKYRTIVLPEGYLGVYQKDMVDSKNLNSAIDYMIQGGAISDKADRANAQLMCQILQEPCYNQLRTVEQLGYVVQSGTRSLGNTIGMAIIVQSERDPIHLEHRIEHLLENRIAKMLEDMTEEEFQKQVQSLIQKKLERPKNLKQESERYWDQIVSGFYNFQVIQEDVQELEGMTLERIRLFFKEHVLPTTPKFKKLSTQIRSLRLPPRDSPGREGDQLELRDGSLIIHDVQGFKANSILSSSPHSAVDLLRYSKL